ncbi:SDR family oxidoreductase [Actinacidiphila glaucinigra]|uniref:SDR family oxidoreductase n=1 Tax=Actinacidiphila glaucinigra TaxID=235986 RepID=UPI0037A39D2D
MRHTVEPYAPAAARRDGRGSGPGPAGARRGHRRADVRRHPRHRLAVPRHRPGPGRRRTDQRDAAGPRRLPGRRCLPPGRAHAAAPGSRCLRVHRLQRRRVHRRSRHPRQHPPPGPRHPVHAAHRDRLHRAAFPARGQGVRRDDSLGRHAAPEKIARTVLHLAGDDASSTTGATVAVDGGMSVREASPS